MEKNDPRKLEDPKKRPERLAGKRVNINDKKPAKAVPVPPGLVEKYHHQISSVWWHAKGREEDPTIGVEIKGVRKTYGGYVWNDWWYFMKAVHPPKEKGELPQCYWYRKKKIPDPDHPDSFKILEEYVGAKLLDPDTGNEIHIVKELRHSTSDLCG